jgi:protein-disulfide isomerase
MIASSRLALLAAGAVCALLGGVGSAAWQSHHANRADTEAVVHDYLLAHPEVLPEALDRLRQHEGDQQVPALRAQAEKGWPGAVLGNPHGSVTLVEFTDFACGYCRRSVADLAQLTQANRNLRIVVRELPILTPESRDAAKMALVAAGQGRYPGFYTAMFAIGRPDAAGIAAAARAAGLDMTRARAALADPRLDAEIDGNIDLARRLGFSGTPSWLVGNTLLSGAVGVDELGKAIAAARR